MNVDPSNNHAINPAIWEPLAVREILAARNVPAIYKLLQHQGVSQRRIAALTGQSQSEVSEILAEQRQVMAYDVLVRIADGLSIPRGYMGLAYDAGSKELTNGGLRVPGRAADEGEEVRQLLSHAAGVTLGAALVNVAGWWQPVERTLTPAPRRIGDSDVAQVGAITRSLRATDYQYGGGACRDAVVAQVRWAQRFLSAEYSDAVGRRCTLCSVTCIIWRAGPRSTSACTPKRGRTLPVRWNRPNTPRMLRWSPTCSTGWANCTCTAAGPKRP